VEEEEDRLQDDKQTKIKDATFQIVGTVSSQTEKCSFISEEYSVNKSTVTLLQHYAEYAMSFMSCNLLTLCQPLYFFNNIPFHLYQHLKHEELLRHLMKCDVIIFDINQHADQIAEAQWAVSGINFFIESMCYFL